MKGINMCGGGMISQFKERDRSVGIDTPILIASLALNILGLVTPLAILLIFDRIIPFQSTETLAVLTAVLLIGALLELCLHWARSVILNAAARRAAVDNHTVFLETVLRAKTDVFGELPKATYLERYSSIARMRDQFSGQNQALSIDLPFSAVFVVMVALIGGWVVLVPIGAFVAIALFAFAMKRAQSTIFNTRKILDQRRYAFLSEVLENMVTVKTNTMERQMTRRFESLQEQTVDTSYRLIRFSGFAQSFGAVFSQSTIAAMGLLGAYFVIQGTMGIAELAACMMLNGRIIQPLMKLMTHWVQSEGIALSKSKLVDMTDLPLEPLGNETVAPLSGALELKDLTVHSKREERPPFHPISCRIAPGGVALLDGIEGRAVDDLFAAITGRRAPASGQVRLNENQARAGGLRRGRHGLVQLEQNAAIFAGNLLENISGFGSGPQIERAVELSRRIGLERRINRLPLGYNTMMGSGDLFEKDPANRQLIALVRAFSIEPKILLMNEPTAILDTPDREAFCAFVADLKSRPTILVASPDPRIRRIATQVIQIEPMLGKTASAWIDDAAQDRAASLERKKTA